MSLTIHRNENSTRASTTTRTKHIHSTGTVPSRSRRPRRSSRADRIRRDHPERSSRLLCEPSPCAPYGSVPSAAPRHAPPRRTDFHAFHAQYVGVIGAVCGGRGAGDSRMRAARAVYLCTTLGGHINKQIPTYIYFISHV